MTKSPTVKDENNDDTDIEQAVNKFLVKHIRGLIVAIFIICITFGSILQIPQFTQFQKELDKLNEERNKDAIFKVLIEKNLSRLLDISKREDEKEILREAIRDINAENIDKINKALNKIKKAEKK